MATRKAIALVSGLFQEINTPTDGLDFAGNDTDDLSEGSTNEYFTQARARGSISLSTVSPSPATGLGSLTYDSSSGAFEFTQVTDAVVRGLLSATSSTGITYTSSTGVFALSSIPNSSLTNSSIDFEDARGVTTTVALGDTYQIKEAENVVELVRNETGSTLAKGTPVAIVGYASGSNRPLVAPADANDATRMPCIGLVAEQITNNANGAVIATGVAQGYDTSSFTAGDTVYISTTAGDLTTTPPTGEASQIQNIGKVTKVASNGRILVLGPGRSNATPNLDDGKIFIGNASNQSVTDTLDTGIVPESGNLYFTNTRARDAISVTDSGGDGSLGYDSSTGVITYTGPSAAEVRAHFSVTSSTGISYNSSTGVFALGSIPNSSLSNSSVTIGTSAVSLGSSTLTLAGLTSVTSTAVVTNDGGFRVRNTADNTKQLAFALSGITASTTRTLTVQDANDTIVVLGTDQTFTGNNTFRNSSGQRFEQAATNDAVVINGRGGGSGSFAVFLTPEALGANRTIVLPNAGGTVSLRDVNETISGTKTFTASNTFRNSSGQRFEQASTNDGVVINGRGGGSNSYAVTLTPQALGANRTITIPNETGAMLTSASTIPGGTFVDDTFRISDNSDSSKKLAFECSGITASNTRTMTVPDTDGTISTESFATAIAVALG